MAPNYKLTYFNARGFAEPARFILAYAGVDFEDIRIAKEEWPEVKLDLNLPFGQLPLLEVDGVVIAQSRAIARYLALEHHLAGNNYLEHAKCDMIVDGVYDVFHSLNRWRFEAGKTEKDELEKYLLEISVPKAMQQFHDLLLENGSGYFVGDSVTWADLTVVYGIHTLCSYLPTLLDSYVALKNLNDKISENPNLAKYLSRRPVTEF